MKEKELIHDIVHIFTFLMVDVSINLITPEDVHF